MTLESIWSLSLGYLYSETVRESSWVNAITWVKFPDAHPNVQQVTVYYTVNRFKAHKYIQYNIFQSTNEVCLWNINFIKACKMSMFIKAANRTRA